MGCTNPAALSFNIARRKAASLKICPHTWDVIRSLRNQIALVRLGQDLNEGKLEYFREAIASSHFHQVVELVKDLLNCALFSTLHEIESMEIAITNHDRTGLIVQCCMILHLCELIACPKWQLSHPAREHPWLFESHGSLEDIAYSRSRLHFVVQASYVGKAIGYSLVYAVEERFREPDSVPKWQDLLLVFRESSAPFLYILLPLLIRVLLREEDEMPREAATLFLSYASDAIYFLANNIGNYVDALEATMIEMLLKRGATPMISREQHHVLFRRLKDQIHTKRAPWWTEAEDFATENHKRFPTALNRFLAHEWELSFLNRLALHTCCSLDATDKFKDNYRVNRVISLRCLAAQNLRESDLDVLSPTQRFIASKHLPNSSFKQYLNLK